MSITLITLFRSIRLHGLFACTALMILLPVSAPKAETLTWDYSFNVVDDLVTWQETSLLGSNWLSGSVSSIGSGGSRAELSEGDILSYHASVGNTGDFGFNSNNGEANFQIGGIRFESGRDTTTIGGLPFIIRDDGVGITNVSGNKQIIGSGVPNPWYTESINLLGNIGITAQSSSDLDINLVVSGGAIVKSGAGTLSLNNGANSYSQGTRVLDGTVLVSKNGALGTGTLTLNGADTELEVASGSISLSNDAVLNSAGTFRVGGGSSLNYFGEISGGAFNKAGDGRLTLFSANTYTGDTTVDGELVLMAANALSEGGLTLVTGEVVVDLSNLNQTIDFLSGGSGGTVKLGGGSLTIDGSTDSLFMGEITGNPAATLIKAGTGVQSFFDTVKAEGGLIINGGTVRLVADDIISDNTGVTIFNDGILDLNDRTEEVKFIASDSANARLILGDGGIFRLNGGEDTTFAGGISGDDQSFLVKYRGDGTLTLSGDNSEFLGTVRVNAGTLKLGDGDNLSDAAEVQLQAGTTLDLGGTSEQFGSFSGSGGQIDVSGSARLTTGANNADHSFAGTIDGDGSLEKMGTGTLILSGANTYSEGTFINGGTLEISDGNNLSTGGLSFDGGTLSTGTNTLGIGRDITLESDGGGFEVDNAGDGSSRGLSLNGVISGAGGLSKHGSGTLFLAGVNTYSGSTTINGGTVLISADNNLGASDGELRFAGGTLRTLSSMSMDRAISLRNGGGTLNVDDTKLLTLDGVISSSHISVNRDLTKTGSGTVALGGRNTYNGDTRIEGGTLRQNIANALSKSSDVLISDGATFDLNGKNAEIASLESVDIGGNGGTVILDDKTLTLSSNFFERTFSGTIEGSAGKLIKTGDGTQILAGANTYGGGTSINGGTIEISADNNLGASSGGLSFDGGTLDTGTNSVTIDRAITLESGGGGFAVDNTDNGSSRTLLLNGMISGDGGLTKTGTGILALNGANTYLGDTLIAEGTLRQGVVNAISQFSDVDVSGGATFDLNGKNAAIQALNSAGSGGNVVIRSRTLTLGVNDGGGSFSGTIEGTGKLIKTGSGIQTLTGASTFSGRVVINEGTLEVSADNNLGASSSQLFFNGGTLGTGTSSVTMSRATTLQSGGGTFSNDLNGRLSLDGVVSSIGALTKTGSGILALNGVNTYSGGTFINGGTVEISADNNLGASSGGLSFDGGTLDTGENSVFIDRAITLQSGGATFAVDSTVFGTITTLRRIDLLGGISGTGGLTKTGSGTLFLDGVNTYSGDTEIKNGRLGMLSSNATSGSSDVILSDGTEFVLYGRDAAIGTLESAGSGDDGGTVILSDGALTLGSNDGSGSFRGVISGDGGTLIKTGTGTQTLDGANTYSGGTFINGGTLEISADNNLGASSGGLSFDGGTLDTGGNLVFIDRAITLQSGGGTFAVDNLGLVTRTFTLNGVIDGDGGLTKTGSGTVALGGLNSYLGDTLITDGTLRQGVVNAMSKFSNVVVSDGATFNLGRKDAAIDGLSSVGNDGNGGTVVINNNRRLTLGSNDGSGSFSGSIEGSNGRLRKIGTGTQTLSGANTYSGGTFIDGGTVEISADNNLGASSGGLSFDGGTLDTGTNSVTMTRDITLESGGGTFANDLTGILSLDGEINGGVLYKQGLGELVLEGVTNLSDGIFVNAGVVNLSGGELIAHTIDTTSSGSEFKFTGGRLAVDTFNGDLVNQGGTLAPGNSPGITTINGDYTQELSGIFDVELGGLFTGEYDALDVNGTANLGGTLNVDFYDLGSGLFDASLGDTFDILFAENLYGEFDLLTLAILGEGLDWQLDYLIDFDGTTDIVQLSVVSTVPVPAAVWLFGSGLIGLIGVARRKKA